MLGILFSLGFGDEMMEKYENELMGRLYSGVPYGKMLAVTSRGLCEGDFWERVEKIAAKGPRGILLREKDLDAGEYVELARRVLEICRRYGTACILHSWPEAARELGCSGIHLSFGQFLKEVEEGNLLEGFGMIGVSVHSAEEAVMGERMGAGYVTAGHVFLTECKKGLPARGLPFLRSVCESVRIPVYAIGGITPDRVNDVLDAGAAGFCVMSGIMHGSLWGSSEK